MDALSHHLLLKAAPRIGEAIAVAIFIVLLEFAISSLSPAYPRGSDAAYWHVARIRAGESVLLCLYWFIRIGGPVTLGFDFAGVKRSLKVFAASCLMLGLLAVLCEFCSRLLWSASFLGGMAANGPKPTSALVVAGVLVGPFMEELFFRGFLYGSLRSRFGVALSVMLVTALFAAAHLPYGQVPLVQVVGGIFFALAFEFSSSLLAPIMVHMAGNLAIFLLPMVPFFL